jgi:hypothetical protein
MHITIHRSLVALLIVGSSLSLSLSSGAATAKTPGHRYCADVDTTYKAIFSGQSRFSVSGLQEFYVNIATDITKTSSRAPSVSLKKDYVKYAASYTAFANDTTLQATLRKKGGAVKAKNNAVYKKFIGTMDALTPLLTTTLEECKISTKPS